jgi:hypothetical protein
MARPRTLESVCDEYQERFGWSDTDLVAHLLTLLKGQLTVPELVRYFDQYLDPAETQPFLDSGTIEDKGDPRFWDESEPGVCIRCSGPTSRADQVCGQCRSEPGYLSAIE